MLIKGEVISFKSFPLRIDFKAPIGSKYREWLNASLLEGEDNIQMKCDVKSDKEKFESSFGLYTENFLITEIVQKSTICGIKISSLSSILPYLLDESSNLFKCHSFEF
jgi:hypothetical protein